MHSTIFPMLKVSVKTFSASGVKAAGTVSSLYDLCVHKLHPIYRWCVKYTCICTYVCLYFCDKKLIPELSMCLAIEDEVHFKVRGHVRSIGMLEKSATQASA